MIRCRHQLLISSGHTRWNVCTAKTKTKSDNVHTPAVGRAWNGICSNSLPRCVHPGRLSDEDQLDGGSCSGICLTFGILIGEHGCGYTTSTWSQGHHHNKFNNPNVWLDQLRQRSMAYTLKTIENYGCTSIYDWIWHDNAITFVHPSWIPVLTWFWHRIHSNLSFTFTIFSPKPYRCSTFSVW